MPGFKGTLEEYKAGALHSGSKHGPIVKNRKQALAIAFSEAGEKKRGKVKSSIMAQLKERKGKK